MLTVEVILHSKGKIPVPCQEDEHDQRRREASLVKIQQAAFLPSVGTRGASSASDCTEKTQILAAGSKGFQGTRASLVQGPIPPPYIPSYYGTSSPVSSAQGALPLNFTKLALGLLQNSKPACLGVESMSTGVKNY